MQYGMKSKRAPTSTQQRGALMFITPMLLLLIVMFGALMMDGARLYSIHQDLQSQANAAVTAAAGAAQTCSGTDPETSEMQGRALVAAESLGFDAGQSSMVVKAGVILANDGKVSSFQPVDNFDQSNGALVTITSQQPISMLLPKLVLGDITLQASAAAKKETYATFYTDGYTASVNTDNSPLLSQIFTSVLGQNINLDLASLTSLGNTVGDLGAIVGNISQTTGIPLDKVLGSAVPASAIVSALKGAKGLTADATAALDEILSSAGVETDIKLSNVIDVVGSTKVPGGAEVPVLAVLNSLILNLAEMPPLNGTIPLTLDPLLGSLGLGSLASISANIKLDQAPAVVVAPARKVEGEDGLEWGHAVGADITIELNASIQAGSEAFSALTLKLPLKLSTGVARAELVGATCGQGSSNSVGYTFNVQRSLLTLSAQPELIVLGAEEPKSVCWPSVRQGLCFIPPAESFTPKYKGLLGAQYGDCCYPPPKCSGLIDIELSSTPVTGDAVPSTSVSFYDLPLHGYEAQTKSVSVDNDDVLAGSIDNLLAGITVTKADIACLPLGNLLNLTVSLVRPVVKGLLQPLATGLLGPLLDSLGVSLGKATVHVIAVDQPAVQLLQYCGPDGC